jgi:hypothetical protein
VIQYPNFQTSCRSLNVTKAAKKHYYPLSTNIHQTKSNQNGKNQTKLKTRQIQIEHGRRTNQIAMKNNERKNKNYFYHRNNDAYQYKKDH